MANNKVIYGNTTIMDITDTTAEASDVAAGEVFYDRGGVRTVGTGNYMVLYRLNAAVSLFLLRIFVFQILAYYTLKSTEGLWGNLRVFFTIS